MAFPFLVGDMIRPQNVESKSAETLLCLARQA